MPLHDVQAVVLGLGGETHLHPLTRSRSKPAVPIGGQFRLIDIPISNCIHSGITRIFVLTQSLSATLHRHVHRTYQFDVFSGGSVEILATDETSTGARWCQGTADAVRRQIDRIRSREPQDVLILAGDHLYRMDYGQLVSFHRGRGVDVTVAPSLFWLGPRLVTVSWRSASGTALSPFARSTRVDRCWRLQRAGDH